MGDVHPFQHFHHLLFAFALLAVQIDKRQLHILVDGQFVYQVEILEDKADIPFTESGELAFTHLIDLLIVKIIFAGSRRVECPEDIQQGRFTAT